MKPKRVESNKKANCRPTPNRWHKMNHKQRREMLRRIQSEDLSLEVVHPDAAGIDIGNESLRPSPVLPCESRFEVCQQA